MQQTFLPANFVLGSDVRSLAALLVGAVEPSAFQPAELVALTNIARKHSVTAMLYRQLDRARVDLRAPEWQILRAENTRQVVRYLQFKGAFQTIATVLHQANIPSIWLKGFALAHSIYPNPALRSMRDLDVLVPSAQRDQALTRLEQAGFTADWFLPSQTLQDMYHHYHLRGPVALEIHYRLIAVHSKFFTPADMKWFWAQTRTIRCDDLNLTVLAPEAMLLHLCAHAILTHGEPEFLLQRYLDLHFLVRSAPTLDWQLVLKRAQELRWTYAIARALEITREYFGTAIPGTLLQELDVRRPSDENYDRAFHDHTHATMLEFTRNYMRGMNRREKIRWAWDAFIPNEQFMRWRYRIRTRWLLPLFYVYRWFTVLYSALQTMYRWFSRILYFR